MEKNYFDQVIDELHKTQGLVEKEIHRRFGNTNPFRMKPVDNKTIEYIYDNMTPEDMNYAIQTYGEQAINDFIYEQEQAKLRRQK